MNFEGENVVVTGGTRGIGRAVALDFLEHGARVVAIYKSNDDAARAFADECARFEGRFELVKLDVADYGAVEKLWQELDAKFESGVQIVVHSSGIRRDRVLAMMSREEWRDVLDTNLTGTFHVAKFAVQHMLMRRYGRIVLVTSPAREHGFEGQANYAASKAGQVGLMRSLARETASRGITVNCVSPGFIDTELIADLDPEVKKRHLAGVPIKRFGTAKEVAYAVRSLCSREATYITGSVLDVAGGL